MGVLDGLPAGLRGWLDELDPATLEAFRELDETYVPVGSYVFPDDTALGRRARRWRDAEWRTMGLWTQLRLRTTDGSPLVQSVPMAVARRRLRWTPQELRLLWATTLGAPESRRRTDFLYRIPVSAVQHLPPGEREPVLALLRQAQRELDGTPYASSWQAKRVLDGLLTEHPTGDPADAARSLVPEGDAFAALVREEYGRRLGDPASLPLARHWVTATTGNPSAKWTARAAELLTPGAAALIKDVLGRLPAHRETVVLQRYGGYERRVVTYLDERTAVLLRGMLWTLDLVDEPWVVPLLGDIALAAGTGVGGSGADSRSELVANAAIGGLARRGGLEVVAHLARVQAKVRKKSILSRVSRTLDAVAERTGLSPEQLLERTVPTSGSVPTTPAPSTACGCPSTARSPTARARPSRRPSARRTRSCSPS
ncbi:hypothetical protein [Nonomuraea aridisoli]|uniref:hypothetical protein n=1 Tax=Nonomuraea aridisoli TaxID=2070368 RepID=UPI0011B94443|nr:hypothetical protein [Nonomuraea aridisoli]